MARAYGLRNLLIDGNIVTEANPAFRVVRNAFVRAATEISAIEPVGMHSGTKKTPIRVLLVQSGGQYWIRTSDLHNVNVAL